MRRAEYAAWRREVAERTVKDIAGLHDLITDIADQAAAMSTLAAKLKPEQVNPAGVAVMAVDLENVRDKLHSARAYLETWRLNRTVAEASPDNAVGAAGNHR